MKLYLFRSVLLGLVLAAPRPAQGQAAPPKGDQGANRIEPSEAMLVCVEQHEQAQIRRLAGELLSSQRALHACASEQCPSAVRSDCVGWLDELRQEIPTVIFEAEGEGGSLEQVTVARGTEVVVRRLDGVAHAFDPGNYEFVFQTSDGQRRATRVLLRQGERNRLISVNFRPPPQPEVPPPARPTVPAGSFVFAGVAVVATASTIGFGVSAKTMESHSLEDCAPMCSQERVNRIKTHALVADVSLGLAIGSAIAAGALFLVRREAKKSAHRFSPLARANTRGAWLGVSGDF